MTGSSAEAAGMAGHRSPVRAAPGAEGEPEGEPLSESELGGARAAPLGRMLRVWIRQEILLLLREPVAVFFSLAFPAVIYVFIGIPYADEVVDDGLRFIDVVFPALVGTVAANLLLMGLPIYVAELRGREVDKRYRAMPLPPGVFGAAVVIAMLTLVAAASAVIVAMVAVGSGLRAEVLDPLFVLLNLAFVAMLCPIGFFLGTLAFSARTIQALTAAVFFVLFFGSGAAAPLDGLPGPFRAVLEWNPLKIWFDLLVTVYVDRGVELSLWLRTALTVVVSALALAGGLRNWKRVP
jgi:ABC-2 type transport system permease protein